MWVEELRLKNIKCFEDVALTLGEGGKPYPWITFLSENGGGKSTALQALALLLAGIGDAQILLPRPLTWVGSFQGVGSIMTRIHLNEGDGKLRKGDLSHAPLDAEYLTDDQMWISMLERYSLELPSEASAENKEVWSLIRKHFPDDKGCFAAGYGAFRRLKRSAEKSFQTPVLSTRADNFQTQFDDDKALTTFDDWIFSLDYRISKTKDEAAIRQLKIGIDAIDRLLPEGVRFEKITDEGQVTFNVNGVVVPTLALSDGYRSVLALAGDLIFRFIRAFPDSENPLHETGVVLIDELDIHLHPTWQREIATLFRTQFPNLQFIVATHSPLIVAGAGSDSVTYKFELEDGKAQVSRVDNQTFKSVEKVLTGDAFELPSPFSPEAQTMLDEYDALMEKGEKRTKKEGAKLDRLSRLIGEERPFGEHPEPGSLEAKMEAYIRKTLK